MFEPTSEQLSILEAFNAGKDLKIHAFAGTGKTSTLYYLASNTKRQGLYFAFNKRVAKEAKKKMPANVLSVTVHSLAWKWASNNFSIEKLIKNPTHYLVEQEIDVALIKHFSPYKTHRAVLLTITRFCQSGDVEIKENHLPWNHKTFMFDAKILERCQNILINMAQCIWTKMSKPGSEFPLGHDGYLKLWSLTNPSLPYDFLFVDEAQDLSPVMVHILNSYQGQKVIVGDAQQQIYSWRGALNTMSNDMSAENLFLTMTFRFGDDLAKIANRVLTSLSVEEQIVSANGTGTKISTASTSRPDAILFRKNVNLIRAAVSFYLSGLDYHIVDPNKNISQTVDDFFRLNNGLWGKSQVFEGFNSWEKVVELAQAEDDNPFRGYVDLFENNNPIEIKASIDTARKRASTSYSSLSTIHQAKGLEWSAVQLFGDFRLDYQGIDFSERQEELRLLYVGLTRAEKLLMLPEELLLFCQTTLGHRPERYAVIDLETTGLYPDHGDKITEVGIVMLENGQIVDRYQSLVNPEMPIPSSVQELTGITDEMVMSAPKSDQVLAKAMAFIGNAPLVAHNASFDRKFLNAELRQLHPSNKVNLLCTFLLSRRLFTELTVFKLGHLVSHLNIPQGQEHRALSDAEMAAHLLMKIKAKIKSAGIENFSFDPDNLMRISKGTPKSFKHVELREGITNCVEKYSNVTYSFSTFRGLQEPKLIPKRAATPPKIISTLPEKKETKAKIIETELQLNNNSQLEKNDQVKIRKKSIFPVVIMLIRRLLLVINWAFFGVITLAMTVSVFGSEDIWFPITIGVISFCLGLGAHRLISRIK